MELQKKIRKEGRRNPWKVGKVLNTPFLDTHSMAKQEWAMQEKEKESERQLARERFKAKNPDYKTAKPQRLVKEKFAAVPKVALRKKGLDNCSVLTAVQKAFPAVTLFRQPDITPDSVADLGPEYILDLETGQEQYTDLVRFLKEDEDLDIDLLLQVTAVDWQDHFDVLVHLLSTRHGHKIFLRCPVTKKRPEILTISDIFRGAEWHEREVFDLFGIRFTGHPDMRRIFLQDDFPGYPLRKDFEDPDRVVKRPY
jgi:NADH:ubiquinone oxidoreductase subunit C